MNIGKYFKSPPTWAGIAIMISILGAPFLIGNNALAQAFFGLITSVIATGIGIWTSWRYSQTSDQERLTRYGLLAWRGIDALSVKVRQQIQLGTDKVDVYESWLLDIDNAKWAWRDLLREVFELQERLTLEKDEVAQEYKKKISGADDDIERANLEAELKLKMASIRTRAPLPISEDVTVACPQCGNDVVSPLGGDSGSTNWPECSGCGAYFPIHRKPEGEVVVNSEAMKIPIQIECPHCAAKMKLRVAANKPVHFRYLCGKCAKPLEFDGTRDKFTVKAIAGNS